jgi:hypothetical protein
MPPKNAPELPVYVQEVVARLRRTKPSVSGVLERLLAEWSAGDSSEKARIESQIVQLGKTNVANRALYIIFGFVFLVLGYYFYAEAHLSSQVDKGVRAIAKVERLSEGFCLLGTKKTTCVNLTLMVHSKGRRPFRSSLTRSLSERWLSRVQPGSWIVVAIDKADPTVIYINEVAFEEPPPSPPPLPSD